MSSGGARPKKSSQRYPPSVDRSFLPDDLRNNIYLDVLLIYSPEDEKLAQSFLTETRNKIKDHNYIVSGYLDKQVWVNPADGLPDYKRCSAFMYLFTGKKSVKDYLEVTKHGHLRDLIYEENFIPVLTEPEGDLDLPMSATVPCPLRYCKQQTSDWAPAIKKFLKKHANIRKEKESEHKKKEQAFLDSKETDTPVTPTNKPTIINGKFIIIGDGGNIIVNEYTPDEKGPFMSQQYQNDVSSNAMKQFSPTCNNRPVAREIPTEASFPDFPSISSMSSQEPSNNDVYGSRGARTEYENCPSPKEVCRTIFSFSNISDSYRPPSETNIPIPDQQKRHTHAECVEIIASHDSLQSVLPGDGLNLGSLQDCD